MEQTSTCEWDTSEFANTPSVVSIKFHSVASIQMFVTTHRDRKIFDGYWCNIAQTEDEREEYRKNIQSLSKIKRTILELTDIDSKSIVVTTVQKKILKAEWHQFRYIVEVKSHSNII